MSHDGDESTDVQSLRARAEQDRVELGDTVEELAAKLDVKHQAARATTALSESATRWLRVHRNTVIATAATAALLLVALVWRRKR